MKRNRNIPVLQNTHSRKPGSPRGCRAPAERVQEPPGGMPGLPAGEPTAPYISSGALMPSTARPFPSTMFEARQSASRATVRGTSSVTTRHS